MDAATVVVRVMLAAIVIGVIGIMLALLVSARSALAAHAEGRPVPRAWRFWVRTPLRRGLAWHYMVYIAMSVFLVVIMFVLILAS